MTKLAELIKAASGANPWEMIKGEGSQQLLSRFCRLAIRKSAVSLPAWPGDSAGRGALRLWLGNHFPKDMLLQATRTSGDRAKV